MFHEGLRTFSFTLREELRFKVSANRMLRSIFETMRGKDAGGWRNVCEEFHDLYCSQNTRKVGHVACTGNTVMNE